MFRGQRPICGSEPAPSDSRSSVSVAPSLFHNRTSPRHILTTPRNTFYKYSRQYCTSTTQDALHDLSPHETIHKLPRIYELFGRMKRAKENEFKCPTVAYTTRALTAVGNQRPQPHRGPQPRVSANNIRANSSAYATAERHSRAQQQQQPTNLIDVTVRRSTASNLRPYSLDRYLPRLTCPWCRLK